MTRYLIKLGRKTLGVFYVWVHAYHFKNGYEMASKAKLKIKEEPCKKK